MCAEIGARSEGKRDASYIWALVIGSVIEGDCLLCFETTPFSVALGKSCLTIGLRVLE